MLRFGPPNIEKLKKKQKVNQLIKALYYKKDDIIRSSAAMALGELKNTIAVEPLMNALGDEYKYLRSSAAESLGQLGDTRAVDRLVKVLSDRESNVKISAVKALGQLGDVKAVEPIIMVLFEQDVRIYAVDALSKLGDIRAVTPLIMTLGDSQWEIRKSSVEALGNLGDVRAVEPINTLLDDKEKDVRQCAVESLGKLKDTRAAKSLIKALGDIEKDIRVCAAIVLGDLGISSANEPLIRRLCDPDWEVRKSSVEALDKLGDSKWKNYVTKNLVEDIKGFINVKDSRIIEPLIMALRDSRWEVRKSSIEALAKIGDTRAVKPVISAIHDRKIDVRVCAVEALGQFKDTHALEALIKELEYNSGELSEYATKALGEMGDNRAVEPLIRTLENTDWRLKKSSAEALGQLGDARAVAPLIRQLGDSSGEVRKSSADSLYKLGESKWKNYVSNNILLDIESFQEIKDPRVIEPLINALDNNINCREKAAEVLGKIGDSRPIQKLLEIAKDGSYSATEALVNISDPSILEELHCSKSILVRRNAAEVMARKGDLSIKKLLPKILFEWMEHASGKLTEDEGLIFLANYSGMGTEILRLGLEVLSYKTNIEYGSSSGGNYNYSNLSSYTGGMDSILELCQREGNWATSILYLVSRKKDVVITLETCAPSTYTKTLSFEDERIAALQELSRRGVSDEQLIDMLQNED